MKIIFIYWLLYGIIFIYHAYTCIGLQIFSLNAYKLGKKIKKFDLLKTDYFVILDKFKQIKYKFNNTLYKKNKITLILPEMNLLTNQNTIFKFRIILSQNIDETFCITLYCDVISKYLFFLFIYFLPFIFTSGLIFNKHKIDDIFIALIFFIIIFIPFLIISLIIQKRGIKNFIKKVEKLFGS